MLSFAAVALNIDKKILGTFSRNLNTLPDAVQDESTMIFWSKFPEAYAATRQDCIDSPQAFIEFRDWLNGLKSHGAPVFAAYPGRFDLRFIDWYSLYYLNESLLGISAIDLKTYACAVLKIQFKDTSKKKFPKRWFSNLPHTHVALDDALEQGLIGVSMLRENMKLVG
jgi:hypothetical protein